MAGWTPITEAVVLSSLPTDMAARYATWVAANPTRAGRLVELAAETVAAVRDAVSANPANELDADPNSVPMAGFRHALNMVMFNLGMEMGVTFSGEVDNLITRAEIWLRSVQVGSIPVGSAGAKASPSYAAPEAGERALEG